MRAPRRTWNRRSGWPTALSSLPGKSGPARPPCLQSFLEELDDDVVYAVVSQTQLSATQFLQAILAEFGFKPFDKRKVELLDILNSFLIEQYSNGKKVVLIVDEAQNLSTKVLEEVRCCLASKRIRKKCCESFSPANQN